MGVTCSARGYRWASRLLASDANLALAIAQTHGLPELLARVMAARGATPDTAERFLDPTLKSLMPDPGELRDMDRAAERLADAIRSNERLAVFGDYDVDGAASAALLHRFLAAHGQDPVIYIPDRLTEGYGPNEAAFENLIESHGASLIIAVDCGTSSHAPIAKANALGADVIVIDHHLADQDLPPAQALINPNRQDDVSGLGELAAAGVTFMTLVAVTRELRREGWYGTDRPQPDLRAWLDLVALATVCDVVPLRGLNRAFVAKGLTVMRYRENPGLRALCDAAALNEAPTPYALGFILGPRINAGGRIGDSALGARLLSTSDQAEAVAIAAKLESLNKERKAVEAGMLEAAMTQAQGLMDANPDSPFLMISDETWHRGLIGLIASRLVERFDRPALVITWEGGQRGTGSARSLPGVDIGSAVKQALDQGLLLKGGGHAMAAGLTLERDRLDDVLEIITDLVKAPVNAAASLRELAFDGALTAASANQELMAMLDRAGPFGSGNPEPRFVLPSHRGLGLKRVGSNHLRATLQAESGGRLQAIAFRAVESELGALMERRAGEPMHFAGYLRRDHWGGRERLQFVIEDAADPGDFRL